MARRTKEEAMETRERLLESALEIMSEKSFSKVSMNEIAEKIGLSKGAAYWHFKNKNDILVNLIESLCADGEMDFEANGVDFEATGAIRGYFRDKIAKTMESGRYKRINMLLQRKMEWPEDVRRRVFTFVRGWAEAERRMVERLLVKAQGEGSIRGDVSPAELSAVITAIFHGLTLFHVIGIFSIDLLKQTDFIFDALSRELETKNQKNNFQKEQVR
ncbi:MAG: TetR family transcriptional regulator [Synergistaceae bacterium]|nr:TetR family transcriptional regulator [Synergistaceae bacterium]